MDTPSPRPSIRRAERSDLERLVALEERCFELARQSDLRSLKRSLNSPRQRLFVLCEFEPHGEGRLLGAMTLWCHAHTLRLYSIAVDPERRGEGLGGLLMKRFFEEAQHLNAQRLSLECDADDLTLRAWYAHWGFKERERLTGYYGPGRDALRCVRALTPPQSKPLEAPSTEVASHTALSGLKSPATSIVLVPQSEAWPLDLPHVQALTPARYLGDPSLSFKDSTRVFNLCAPYPDEGLSYYASLLAAARSHRVFPDVITIKDLSSASSIERLSLQHDALIQEAFSDVKEREVTLSWLFGERVERGGPHGGARSALMRALFRETGLPLATLRFTRPTAHSKWALTSITARSITEVMARYPERFKELAEGFFSRRRFTQPHKLKRYRYDLAILIDPHEPTPPSCPDALEELRRAGERAGFYVELITTHHINRLAEFDALLIRATTRVNHPTYEAARRAHAEGLVVIDDPWSILRCSNKVYLYERLARARVRQPRSWLFYRGEAWRERHPQLSFPLVLKRPEGSFSTGVFKVASADELDAQLQAQWGEGELLIGQEFLPTAFDWRVGVLEHEPLFACQYFMAPGHWQIYQWSGAPVVEGRASPLAGDARGVPLNEVPPAVLSAAVRAASLMGEGLYGVDLKVVGEHVYVIEVNDNPNLDRGVEDEVEGVRLYQRVIDVLMSKIERAREVAINASSPAHRSSPECR